ncbi:hypothetical protein LSAT2_029308 [Lamellibrachia satsuma]|nr:hypothetical protein LSAT2_029308 [Lamellibrachia satsuma]
MDNQNKMNMKQKKEGNEKENGKEKGRENEKKNGKEKGRENEKKNGKEKGRENEKKNGKKKGRENEKKVEKKEREQAIIRVPKTSAQVDSSERFWWYFHRNLPEFADHLPLGQVPHLRHFHSRFVVFNFVYDFIASNRAIAEPAISSTVNHTLATSAIAPTFHSFRAATKHVYEVHWRV